MSLPVRPLLRPLRWLFAAAALIAICLLCWGDELLIAIHPPPQRVDVAIVLQGSIAAEKARIAGAIALLRGGIADRALLSVPKESYWGQAIPPVARAYLERNYGTDLAARIDFCETSGEVNSTVQEVQALRPCIGEHHWQSVVIVTSNYHTRRAGMLWRRAAGKDPRIHVWVEGVIDPEFQRPWWRHRQSAKTWVMEFSKLVWAMLGG
jgi:uncharacterized SAM-binding protein YcdF (DUF218 family)